MAKSSTTTLYLSVGVASTISSYILYHAYYTKKSRTQAGSCSKKEIASSSSANDEKGTYESMIGNTKLIKLKNLSNLLKRNIYVKMECFNPGGTGKDRAAFAMIQHAIKQNLLPPPPTSSTASISFSDSNIKKKQGVVIEGTSGSTGISLASLCASMGYECHIFMPDDQASEKAQILRNLGAKVTIVPNASISNPKHYVNQAKHMAQKINNDSNSEKQAVFINQFENLANFHVHYNSTGPELWKQMERIKMTENEENDDSSKKVMHAFCMGSGTGGTLCGVGSFLKQKCDSSIKIVLIDPPGSVLYNKIKFGVAFTDEMKERCLKRHRYDTIAEGVGLDRITNNFAMGVGDQIKGYEQKGNSSKPKKMVDDAVRVSNQEMVDVAHWLLREEGLFVGSSSAMNVCGAIKVAKTLPENSKIVTIICDGGQRHLSRFWNRDFIENKWNLIWPQTTDDNGANGRRIPDCLDTLC